jgi:SAM-dependent methyltransferase
MAPVFFPPDSSTLPSVVRHGLDEPVGPGPFSFVGGEEVVISGWAFVDPIPPAMPSVVLDSVSLGTGVVTRHNAQRCARPDVARHFGQDQLLMSGFTGRLLIDGRSPGEHRVRLCQIEDSHVYPSVELLSFRVLPGPCEASARKELAARFLRGSGLEVGALQRRLEVPVHCSVTYVDRLPLPNLLEHYPELRGQPLQAPDLIDDGETLSKVTSDTQDFVIANHFLEHCENPIQTILNFLRVLRNGGILYLAVPDKRFTFDIGRPVTPYSVLAETFRDGRRRNRADLYVEWVTYVTHTPVWEVEVAARKLLEDQYSIHFNVWALPDLLELIARCKADFGLPFTLEWLVCSENEVIVILKKSVSQ